jgi:AcrR family transcriptional regulator
MAQKINRQELIVAKATELFMAQGYNATSVRQIAEAAGCTDAALYYHFRDGKRALFQAVIEFPHLSVDEKQLVHQGYLAFQAELTRLIRPFVADHARADAVAWLLICALFGYAQTFLHFEMQTIVNLPLEDFKKSIAGLFKI